VVSNQGLGLWEAKARLGLERGVTAQFGLKLLVALLRWTSSCRGSPTGLSWTGTPGSASGKLLKE